MKKQYKWGVEKGDYHPCPNEPHLPQSGRHITGVKIHPQAPFCCHTIHCSTVVFLLKSWRKSVSLHINCLSPEVRNDTPSSPRKIIPHFFCKIQSPGSEAR